MEPGYYLSELGNFQVWYPVNFFKKGYQRLETIGVNGVENKIDYTQEQIQLIKSILEFEYLDSL